MVPREEPAPVVSSRHAHKTPVEIYHAGGGGWLHFEDGYWDTLTRHFAQCPLPRGRKPQPSRASYPRTLILDHEHRKEKLQHVELTLVVVPCQYAR
jgi:hypothetical protein